MDARDVASAPPRRPRVLIVDDDAGIRLVCAASLSLDGCEVIEASNGQEGLELALTAAPDLVLVDICMPVLDGFGLAAALRGNERTSGLPVVFLTGEVDGHAKARAHALGAHGFLSKPFDPSVVASFVLRVLAQLAPEPQPSPAPGGHSF